MTFNNLSLPRAMQFYQLLRVGSVVLTGILLAKSQLTTAAIGTWEALLFIGSFVVFTGVNGLLQGISPVYIHEDKAGQKSFLWNVFIVFSTIAVFIFGTFLLFKSWIIPLFTGLNQLEGFEWFAFYLLLHIPSLPVEIFYLVQKKPWAIVAWGIVGFGCYCLAIFLPAYAGWGLTGCLQMLCVLAAAKLAWTGWLLWQYAQPTIDRSQISRFLKLSGPMAATSFTGNLIVFFDNWLVGHWFLNPAIFALFRYGSRELPLAQALSTALGTAMVPTISKNPEAGIAELKTRNTRLLHVVMPVTIVLMVAAPQLFPVVFNPDFAAAASLFQIGLLVTLSRVLLPNTILIALGDTKIIFYTGLAELAIKVILGILFIYFWGIPGVLWSAVLSNWFEKIALGIYLHRQRQIPVQQWLNLRVYLIYAITLLYLCPK